MRSLTTILLWILCNTNVFSQQGNDCKIQPFKAYIDDIDVFSNVRATPTGEIILKINNQVLDGWVMRIIDFENGWFKIDSLSGVSGCEMASFEGWVHNSIVGASNTYDLNLWDSPHGKTKVGFIKGENGDTFKILEAHCEWIKIKYNDLIGWVKSEETCGSPVTTCP
ncbi:MAG: hypothetical protein R2781_09445 [Flavobacteriaceae bacterium]